MRILVNALSVTHLSAKHVFFGHLTQLAKRIAKEHHYFILYHIKNNNITQDLGPNVEWVLCPRHTAQWIGRTCWERTILPCMAKKFNVDLLLTFSGSTIPHFLIPQVSYAMNPWALVSQVKKAFPDKLKAHLQRKAYKIAMEKADMMLFLSEYMRQEYRRNNAYVQEKASQIVYAGLDKETLATADQMRVSTQKKPFQILCVSAMAPYKGVETVVEAVYRLQQHYKLPVSLYLVGPWPDKQYERKIRNLVIKRQLDKAVSFKGHVPQNDLYRYYAEAKVFCLMSWCESFGIPALEAQAFGTPVIGSNCCAMPEICGKGGVYLDPGDVEGVSKALAQILRDDNYWTIISKAAIDNTLKYKWEMCSRPLLNIFDIAKKTT